MQRENAFTLIAFVLVLGFASGVATAAPVVYTLTTDGDVITGTITFDTAYAPDDSAGGVDLYIWSHGDGPDSFNPAIVDFSFNVDGYPETFDQSALKFVMRLQMATSGDTPLSLFIDSDVSIPNGPFLYTDSTINFGTGTGHLDAPSSTDITGAALTPDGAPPADTTAPTPNPATFASAPAAISDTEISMTATTGSDDATGASGPVEYLFTETSGNPGGTSSSWQTSTSYTDGGLTASTQYTYTVQMRDSASTPNVGNASAGVSATTDPAPDTTAPTPNPARFASAPAAISDTEISMTATTGTDDSGPVEYLFTCTAGGGHSSTWQESEIYTDTGLTASTEYTYTVQMRDSASTPNVGTASSDASATTCPSGDLDDDCDCDVDDLLIFALQWLDPPGCQDHPDDCADLNGQGGVNGADFAIFAADWQEDAAPPTPNPATFAIAPTADSDTAISMTATTGTDASGPVEYLFTCTAGGGHSSSWQTSESYTDTGLTASTQYTYTVQMRDSAITPNVGTASSGASATTDAPLDTTAPEPNPAEFASGPSADSETAISMTAMTGTDDSGPVEYRFVCTAGGGHDSGWQTSTSYTDTGLAHSTEYTYTVQMRDSASTRNYGAVSSGKSATTPTPDTTAPTPYTASFASVPAAISDTAISMTATMGIDATNPVWYYFDETSGNPGGTDSGWQTSTSYTDTGLAASTQYTYTVQMRDSVSPTPNVGAASSGASATTDPPHILPVLVINEMMASNNDAYADNYGEYDDWIEIHNPGSSTVDMAGMFLADDGNTWTIPSGVSIAAGGYMLFWADGQTDQGDLHTNFKLSASGDSVTLYDTDGITVIDTKSFSSMDTDVSYGRYPNATDNWYNMANATPGATNVAPMSGEVYFSRPAGLFKGSFSLGLTTESAATIRYTTDGSKPTASYGQIYDGVPITVNGTLIIRAAAIESGRTLGPVETNSYISLDDVYSQPDQPAGFPDKWHDRADDPWDPIKSVDYGMDPAVIGAYAAQLNEAFTSIPTMSIVMDIDDLFTRSSGIYPNSYASDQKPASVELIHSDGTQGFEINCNIRNHGAGSRDISENLKHSFRLLFNGENGAATKLHYPLFEGSPVEQFDTIVLRGGNNFTWNNHGHGGGEGWHRETAQCIRDIWGKDTQLALGQPASRGTYVHLYLNGLYWGLYNPIERPNAPFLADHLGGEREDWDSINGSAGWDGDLEDPDHHIAQVIDGDSDAWYAMMAIADGGLSSQSAYDDIQEYLDVENLIDYVIVQHYTQNTDWEESNWYVGRRRLPVAGYKFFIWDVEYSFFDVNRNMVTEDWPFSPRRLYNKLRENPEFRLLFADHLHRHFFNGGLMTPEPCRQRWMRRANEIDTAIIGESARWGDAETNYIRNNINDYPKNGESYTRDGDWIPARDSIINDFMGLRSGILLNQYKAIDLYPDVDAPVFNINGSYQHGGYVPAGASLTMTKNGGGTIWYTTDGSDPRLQGGAVSGSASTTLPYTLNDTKQIKARVKDGSNWSALNEAVFANDSVADSVRITEIMYHPTDPTSAEIAAVNPDPTDEDFEFIEVKNIGTAPINLNLVHFTDGIDFTFGDYTLAAGAFAVVVKNQAAFEARYPGVSPSLIAGTYTGAINNGGERIELVDALGETILNFRFKDGWYPITDGNEFSLNIIDPTDTDLNSWEYAEYWQPSTVAGGTPADVDTGHVALPGDIVISEIMAHTNGYPNDWIELHNTSGSTINIAGWFLSDDDNDFKKYEIQSGSIPAGGYLVLTEDDDFGGAFGFSELGETAYLCSGSGGELAGGFCTKEDFKASEGGVSFGRYTKSASAGNDVDFVSMDSSTYGTANTGSSPKVGPIVITEIMYHPAGNDYAEYVEIKNISGGTVILDNWLLTDETGGIEYYIPQGTNLAAGSYLLLTKNDAALNDEFSPASVTTLEWLEGRLSNGGEKIELQKPGTPEPDGFVPYIRVDRVNYSDGLHDENFRELGYNDPWPTTPDGGGHALHRSNLTSYGNDVANWTAGTPTPGS